MKDTRPTVEKILELYEDCKSRYVESGLYAQFDEDEKYHELAFKDLLKVPDQFKDEAVILPTARDIVDTCVDNTDIGNARVYVNKKGTSPKSDEESNLLRKFGLGVLHRNNVEASIAPLRVGSRHYWLHGLCILKDVWDADKYMDKPEQKEGESEDEYAARIDEWRSAHHDSFPIVIQAVHPKTIMLDPYYDGGEFVFETRDELVYNVLNKYPKWSNPEDKKTSGKVEHISFWTKNYRCELYDREPIFKVSGGVPSHKYGFIPYVAIDSGLGNVDADNDLTKRYVGVLRYIRDILISESRDYSNADIMLKRGVFPWGFIKGQGAAGVTEIAQKYGEYTPLPDNTEIVDMAPKTPPDALLQWMMVSADYLSSHAAPRSVRGLGESGVRSGADRRLIISQAQTRYNYSTEAFKNGVAKVLSNCARIMKNVVPGDLRVWARTPTDEFDIEISKGKMNEPFTFYVDFAPISEEDEYRRDDSLERLVMSGIVTKKWARSQKSNIDPQAMELEEEKERLKNDPMINQMVSQYAAGEMAKAISKKAQEEALKTGSLPVVPSIGTAPQPVEGQMEQPGRRMVPPIPNKAIPGSAGALQNEMQNMRSQQSINPLQGIGGGGNRP